MNQRMSHKDILRLAGLVTKRQSHYTSRAWKKAELAAAFAEELGRQTSVGLNVVNAILETLEFKIPLSGTRNNRAAAQAIAKAELEHLRIDLENLKTRLRKAEEYSQNQKTSTEAELRELGYHSLSSAGMLAESVMQMATEIGIGPERLLALETLQRAIADRCKEYCKRTGEATGVLRTGEGSDLFAE